MSLSYPALPAPWEIPVDFKITKSPLPGPLLSSRDLTVCDAQGRIALRAVDGGDSATSAAGKGRRRFMTIFDSKAAPLFTVLHENGEWKAYRGSISECTEKQEIFTTHNIKNSKFKTKIDIYLSERKSDDPKPSFRLTGNPFRRACTITKQDTLVAQTNLMYKLKKIVYSRRKFRLTVYPRNDHVLVLAMLVTFFWNYG